MKRFKAALVLMVVLCLFGVNEAAAVGKGRCEICNKVFEKSVLICDDKVAGDKKYFCEACAEFPACYLCGLPTADDRLILPDSRVLCLRDSKSVVLDEREALGICEDLKSSLDRQFSRFTSFPETNVVLSIVDRVNLVALFKMPGNDYDCPAIVGYTRPETNHLGRGYSISLMSGQTKSELRATCAHEFAHTWIFENVSKGRQKQLASSAKEGFCELVAYLLMDAQGDRAATATIRSNAYTRGQIDLFIEAERRFGLNDIVEWMKAGEDSYLSGSDLVRVRNLITPQHKSSPVAPSAFPVARTMVKPSVPSKLLLQGVTWSKTRPMAMINGRTFLANEEAKVPLGESNVVVRCLSIRQADVTIQVGGMANQQILRLEDR